MLTYINTCNYIPMYTPFIILCISFSALDKAKHQDMVPQKWAPSAQLLQRNTAFDKQPTLIVLHWLLSAVMGSHFGRFCNGERQESFKLSCFYHVDVFSCNKHRHFISFSEPNANSISNTKSELSILGKTYWYRVAYLYKNGKKGLGITKWHWLKLPRIYLSLEWTLVVLFYLPVSINVYYALLIC